MKTYYSAIASDSTSRIYESLTKYDDLDKALKWFGDIENLYQVRLENMLLRCYDGPNELKPMRTLKVERQYVAAGLASLNEYVGKGRE